MEIHDDGCVLSEDNIYEILTRVALTSLPACISVCKSWRRIAYQPCFGEAHSHHTTKTSGFILQTTHDNEYHHTFLSMHDSYSQPLPIAPLLPSRPHTIYIEATAPNHSLLFYNILLGCNNKNDINPCYYITQLGTTHNLPIPNPESHFETCGVAIFCDTHNIKLTTHEFKLVRISEPRWGPTTVPCLNYCEIFDSSSRKWRRSNDLPSLWLRDKSGIVIKQTAYWIINDIQNPFAAGFSSFSIFAFNVEEEKGIIITKPETTFLTSDQPYEWRMIPYEEWLCLVLMSSNNINVWMMMVTTCDENIQQWEWKGSYSVEYIKNHKFAFRDGTPNKEVVLLETLYRELWYNLQREELVSYMYPPTSIFRV